MSVKPGNGSKLGAELVDGVVQLRGGSSCTLRDFLLIVSSVITGSPLQDGDDSRIEFVQWANSLRNNEGRLESAMPDHVAPKGRQWSEFEHFGPGYDLQSGVTFFPCGKKEYEIEVCVPRNGGNCAARMTLGSTCIDPGSMTWNIVWECFKASCKRG